MYTRYNIDVNYTKLTMREEFELKNIGRNIQT